MKVEKPDRRVRRIKYCVWCDSGYTWGLDAPMLSRPDMCDKPDACEAKQWKITFDAEPLDVEG